MSLLTNIISILVLISLSLSAQAKTPQKYCESLGVSDCEVLDVEVGGCTTNANACSAIIKYCKNQEFRMHPSAQYVTNSPAYYLYYKTSSGSNYFGGGAPTTTKSSASLCADLP